MKKTTLSLTSEFDGYNLAADFYQIDNPLALVVIFGGMMEHKERYQNFAEFLTNQNYAVLVCDHRGHGETAETLGYFGKRLGWLNNLVDLKKMIDVASQTYPKQKKYLVAHSMGTLFARAYLKRYPNDFEKYVLSKIINEIKEISNIQIKYDKIKITNNRKIIALRFYIKDMLPQI